MPKLPTILALLQFMGFTQIPAQAAGSSESTSRNPLHLGFCLDPLICLVGGYYPQVTSTIRYFPGLPIFHGENVVLLEQIRQVLDKPSQLDPYSAQREISDKCLADFDWFEYN